MFEGVESEIKLLLYKYILEIFIGLFVFGYIKNIFKKKWFVIVVFLADILKLKKISDYLLDKIINHKIYSSVIQLIDLESYLTYINNKSYRQYARIIIFAKFGQYHKTIKKRIDIYLKRAYRTSIIEFINIAKKDIKAEKMDNTYLLLRLPETEAIDSAFIRKYLVWTEVYYDNIMSRLNDLHRCNTMIEAIEQYLFIMSDFLEIYQDRVCGIVNSLNGTIKARVNKKNITGEFEAL